MFRNFFTFRWILTTLLVIAAVTVMARLGFWQLDRLEQRKAFNANVESQLAAPRLDLNQQPLPVENLENMEYREVVGRGEFDPANEIILRGQVREGLPGYHLLTPLRLSGSQWSVLVDRGFIPMSEGSPEARVKYAHPGAVEIHGILRGPQNNRVFGVPDPTLTPGQERLDAWNTVNLNRIQEQVAYPLLAMYVQQSPVEGEATSGPPYAEAEVPEISEGSHFGYAIQWFAFAAVLAFGYPFFVRTRLREGGSVS